MTTLEIIGAAIALAGSLVGIWVGWRNKKDKAAEKVEAAKEKVTDEIGKGAKDRNGSRIAGGVNRWRRLFK
jgi:hypothetical protein